MKKGLTEIVFILDRSGSMMGLEADTIGGFNATIARQRQEPGEAVVSTVLFDTHIDVLHDRVRLEDVPVMTNRDYQVQGCTALIDAIGGAIHHIANVHKYARPEDVPEHTIFVITTDGMENASHRYTANQVREMIRKEQEQYHWEFLFLAANIDAVQTAANFGIRSDRAVDYCPDAVGTALVYEGVSEAVCNLRQSAPCAAPSNNWRAKLDRDFKQRGRK